MREGEEDKERAADRRGAERRGVGEQEPRSSVEEVEPNPPPGRATRVISAPY